MMKSTAVVFIVTSLLAVSLALNLYLVKKLRSATITANSVRLDPVQLKRFAQDDKVDERQTAVIFGDSRARGWTSPDLNGFRFINRGIDGETSAQAALRFRHHVSNLQPDVVVVQIGVNDLRMLPLPPKTVQDIVDNCKENIEQIVEQAQTIGATTVLTTIFPLGQGGLSLERQLTWNSIDQMEAAIAEVNDYIRSLGNRENVVVFDAYSLLEKDGKTIDRYAKDLLHIRAQGYEKLNQELAQTLARLEQ
ncbi:MAG: SGNH/GDSL hydrolase family protein [Cyanophyceae cyanobacterium]